MTESNNNATTEQELRDKVERLEIELTRLKDKLKLAGQADEEYMKMIEETHKFIFDDDTIEGRSVVEDLQLLRMIYHRFKSASVIVGFVIGILTVGIPLIIGILQLIQWLIKVTKGG